MLSAARRSKRSSVSTDSDDVVKLFPKECFICGKLRIQKSKIDEHPIVITTTKVVNIIRIATQIKNPELYLEIKDTDLVAKELRYHPSCYRNYTRDFNESEIQRKEQELFPNSTSGEFQRQGDYESVKEYITKHVLEEQQAVSLSVLQTIYGLDNDTRYRSKLKSRIVKDFPTELTFMSVGRKEPEILVSSSIADRDKEGCIIKCAEYLHEEIIEHSKNLN